MENKIKLCGSYLTPPNAIKHPKPPVGFPSDNKEFVTIPRSRLEELERIESKYIRLVGFRKNWKI